MKLVTAIFSILGICMLYVIFYVCSNPDAPLKSIIGYTLFLGIATYLILILPLSIIIKSDLGTNRKIIVGFVTLIAMFYLFLLIINNTYTLDTEIIMQVSYTGFAIVVFDVSLSLYWFNINEWKRGSSRKISVWFKALIYIILSLGALIFNAVYVYKIIISLPIILQNPEQVPTTVAWTNLITLFPISLTLLYIAHKLEKEEEPYRKWPWQFNT
ncbi:hypothetical protein [Brevibacillus nitrificans]|uniref:hypothetical protein n=1 Tax=Brevibacillus nitrificans TaxID=651560 RepID=UPI00261F71E4|nr:hypothetical protein [Brevibacillus nitrificans]